MFHRLARSHLLSLENSRYPISKINYQTESSLTFLNLNTNNLSTGPYTLYPSQKNSHLAENYIKALQTLSYLPQKDCCLNENNFLFTNGSTESIELIMRAFCEPGKDAIIVTPPVFSYYGYRAQIENVEVIKIPLMGENYNIINVSEVLSQTKAKVLFLCSPNNPVGTTLNFSQIEYLSQNFKGIIVVDEAYIEWTDEPSSIRNISNCENLIVLRTFSKIWGLAGVRCGVTIAATTIIELLRFVQAMFNFSLSSSELINAKMQETAILLKHKEEMNKLRIDFFNFLSNLKFVEKVYPGSANFLFAKFHNEKQIEEMLLNKGILVSNTSLQVPKTLRISIGNAKEMAKFKKVFEDV